MSARNLIKSTKDLLSVFSDVSYEDISAVFRNPNEVALPGMPSDPKLWPGAALRDTYYPKRIAV
jgi:hypothetical protein